MKAPKIRKNEARADYLRRGVAALYGAGVALPATRKLLAVALGDPASGTSLLGTVDPIYYRLVGLASPLAISGKTPKGRATSLAKAAAKRRNDGVRWEVLAASIEAATGTRISIPVAKALASEGGVDLAASYVGRGTRVAAPKTYSAPALPAKAASGTS